MTENPAVLVGQPLRIRRDRKADTAAAGNLPGRDVSQFIRYGIDIMHKSIRCAKCDGAVPLEFGDVRGKNMWDWMEAARIAVARQKHDAHSPVLVGAETASAVPVTAGTAGQAATREGDAGERTEPPATAPAKARKAPRQRSVPAVARTAAAAEKRTAAVASLRDIPGVVTASELPGPAAVFQAGPTVDCLHENLRVKGVCPDCKQWVGGKR